jgi:hypothetical protein
MAGKTLFLFVDRADQFALETAMMVDPEMAGLIQRSLLDEQIDQATACLLWWSIIGQPVNEGC